MNARVDRVLLFAIAALGSGCGQDRPDQRPSVDPEVSAPTETEVAPAAEPIVESADEPDPVIDFPLLDKVRFLDLIDSETRFPESLTELDGREVSLIGFMAPFDSLEDMRRCMIVPAYVGCQFCSPPKLTQVVYVNQDVDGDTGRKFPFIEEPSHIVGTLRLSLPGSEHEGTRQGFLYSLEDAVVTPYTGDAPERAPGHGATPVGQPIHLQGTTQLEPVEMSELVAQVAELIGREPLRPIEVEPVSSDAFVDLIERRVEATYPDSIRAAQSRAFALLGMLPDDLDWVDTLVGMELSRGVGVTDEAGGKVYVLDSAPYDHGYVRLEIVGAIAEAITLQYAARLRGERGTEGDTARLEDDDARRAYEALLQGLRIIASYRYSRPRGISPSLQPPADLAEEMWEAPLTSLEFEFWQSIPLDVGIFFVDYFVGAAAPFSGVDPALARPPSTTMELFRPRWYEDPESWLRAPVPSDFADGILETPPAHTDVFGVGGLVPWLVTWYSVDVAKSLVGRWAGDRWAVWQFDDGTSALLLETHWQNDASAVQFREALPDDTYQIVPPYEKGSLTVRVLRADSASALARLEKGVEAL
ncbi:MAG: DUF3299 domain-containing protein [Planctomycetota bacterium]